MARRLEPVRVSSTEETGRSDHRSLRSPRPGRRRSAPRGLMRGPGGGRRSSTRRGRRSAAPRRSSRSTRRRRRGCQRRDGPPPHRGAAGQAACPAHRGRRRIERIDGVSRGTRPVEAPDRLQSPPLRHQRLARAAGDPQLRHDRGQLQRAGPYGALVAGLGGPGRGARATAEPQNHRNQGQPAGNVGPVRASLGHARPSQRPSMKLR